MSVAVDIEAPTQPAAGNYSITRYNALRHGVLSQHTVLPWEDGAEYRAMLEALIGTSVCRVEQIFDFRR